MFLQTAAKRARVAILPSDKIGFKTEVVLRDKEGQYVIIKESTHQKDVIIKYVYLIEPQNRSKNTVQQY